MRNDDRTTVLHLIDRLEGGGTERTLVALLRRFDQERLRHVVVTMRRPGTGASRLPDHVPCWALGIDGRSRLAGLHLARIARWHRASAIHARNTGCWFDAVVAGTVLPGCRIVLGFHGLDSGVELTRRQRRVARLGVRLGAIFTSVCHSGASMLAREAGVPEGRIMVLPNGVDTGRSGQTARDEGTRIRQALGFGEEHFVIGTVGSLTPIKRVDVLVRAWAAVATRFPQAGLLIVGDGPRRATIQAAIDAASASGSRGGEAGSCRGPHDGPRAVITGWRDDVPALLGCMDAYASSSAYEGTSNALLEAMATGLPVVATDVGDHRMLLRGGLDGVIVPPQDENALFATLARLVSDVDLCRRLAVAARQRAATLDFSSTVARYEAFYQTLVGTSDRRAAASCVDRSPARRKCTSEGPVWPQPV